MKNWKSNLPLLLLLAAILFVVGVRIRLLTTPLERDEGEFAYAGQLMLQGIPPYQLCYNMKFPGIYAAYAILEAVFGQTDAGIHFGLLLVNLGCILLLYRLARRFFDVPASAAAAAAYALLSTSPVVIGCEAHATHFVVLAALGGLLLLWRGEDSSKLAWFFGGGLLLGVACLMKQPGALFGMFGFCVLLAKPVATGREWGIHLRRMALFAAGFIFPLVLTALLLWRAGVFDRFWFWTFVYASAHAGELNFAAGMRQLRPFLDSIPIWADGLFWLMAGLGLASFYPFRQPGRALFWMAGFLLFSGVAVSLSYYFTNHYFIMLLPALCLLVGQAFSAAAQRGWIAPASGIFILSWLLTVVAHRDIFFVLGPEQVCRRLYGKNPFLECRQIGHYLAAQSPPDARIAVLGSEPELLFYARRHSATGYIYMYDFFRPTPYAEDLQHEMIRQIESVRPEYVVFVSHPISWNLRSETAGASNDIVKTWMPQFIRNFYQPAGLVLIKDESEYFWGDDAMSRPPFNGAYIAIFKRK